MPEWHYHNDQFENVRTGEHGWRKVSSDKAPNNRDSTHVSGPHCRKLCRDGLWPIPPELKEMVISANPGIGPWGFKRGEHANSWYAMVDGRLFKLTRWPRSFQITEMQYREHQPYSWVPDCQRIWARITDWIGVQSEHGYL